MTTCIFFKYHQFINEKTSLKISLDCPKYIVKCSVTQLIAHAKNKDKENGAVSLHHDLP